MDTKVISRWQADPYAYSQAMPPGSLDSQKRNKIVFSIYCCSFLLYILLFTFGSQFFNGLKKIHTACRSWGTKHRCQQDSCLLNTRWTKPVQVLPKYLSSTFNCFPAEQQPLLALKCLLLRKAADKPPNERQYETSAADSKLWILTKNCFASYGWSIWKWLSF